MPAGAVVACHGEQFERIEMQCFSQPGDGREAGVAQAGFDEVYCRAGQIRGLGKLKLGQPGSTARGRDILREIQLEPARTDAQLLGQFGGDYRKVAINIRHGS